ncbi:MAG: ABC transporter ATP-binding protein [Planctomycetota bacterium]|jgi:ABC-2 type transport system ATP-binding protein
MAAIETNKLAKEYRRGFFRQRHRALAGLDLAVEEGEIFGFLGPNGAGKSTTFKILMGLIEPTSGSATILGEHFRSAGARRGVGFLPEDAYFYSYLTARELLRFYGKLQGMRSRDVAAMEDGLLDRVGLSAAKDVRLGEFSKGMRQRFGIAQALVSDPKLLFLDEPLTGLDPLGRKDLKDLILSLRDDGKTIFFSSHILADAEAICDRVAILVKGELIEVGAIEDLLSGIERSFDLAVEGLGSEGVEELGAKVVKVEGDTIWARLNAGGDPDAALGKAREAGGKIRALIPYRESLEEYFVRRADGGPQEPETRDPKLET